jgi:2-keto-3-deoxy-L-fuconate dehydrogenase
VTDIAGRVALVTAAGQGIGRAIAEALVREGVEVWATDINEAALADIAGARHRKLDVLDDAAVAAVVGGIGPVDILVNCAGHVHAGSILDCAPADLAFAFDLNVTSMFRTIRAVLPGMLARQDGCIINIASVASSIRGVPDRFAYATSKAAIIGLTKSVAADYVTQGIRCNAICPGTVDSPSLQQRLHAQGNYEEARAAFIARQPIGRIGTPEEIADLAVHLAGATFTTGQTHIIDGGWVM